MVVEGVVGVVGIMQFVIVINVSVKAGLVIAMTDGMMGVKRTSAQTRITALTVQQIVEIILFVIIRYVAVSLDMVIVMVCGVMGVRRI